MNSSIHNLKAKSHIFMVLFSMLISGSFILGSIVANEIDPSAISAIRFFVAFLILVLVIKFSKFGKIFFLKKIWRYIVLGGLISIYFVLMFEGLKTASPITMSAIMTLTPFLAAILEYFIYKTRLELIVFFALLIGATGSIWIIFDADFNKLINLNIGHGETLFLIGCFAQALYTILIPALNEGESALEQTSNTMLVSSGLLLIIDFRVITSTNWTELSLNVWITILYLSIFATAIAFFILQYSRNFLTGASVMSYYYIVPMWVLILDITILGNSVKPQIWLGCFAVICTFFIIFINDINSEKN